MALQLFFQVGVPTLLLLLVIGNEQVHQPVEGFFMNKSGLSEDQDREERGSGVIAEPEGEPESEPENESEAEGEPESESKVSDDPAPDDSDTVPDVKVERTVAVKSDNQERVKVQPFQLLKRKNLGFFVRGRKVDVVSQLKTTPIRLTFELPTFSDTQEAYKILKEISTVMQNTKANPILAVKALPKSTRVAITQNLNLGIQKEQQISETLKATREYLLNGKEMNSVPEHFTQYCSSIVKVNTISKVAEIVTQLNGFEEGLDLANLSPAERKTAIFEGLSDSQQAVDMLDRLLKNLDEVNQALEALSNRQVIPIVGLMLQENECLVPGADETIQVLECVVVRNNFVCQLNFLQQNSALHGYLVPAVTYTDFVSTLHNKYLQSATSPALFADITECTQEEGETILKCKSLVWQRVPCFSHAQNKDLDAIFQFCELVRPESDKLRLTSVKKGTLVDNGQKSTSLVIEDKHSINESAILIPYSYTFMYETGEVSDTVRARLPFDATIPVRVTWLNDEQYAKVKAHVDAKYQPSLFDFLESEEYELFSFVYQVVAAPFFLAMLWRLIKKHIINRYEIRRQRKQDKKQRFRHDQDDNFKRIVRSRRERSQHKDGRSHELEEFRPSAPK